MQRFFVLLFLLLLPATSPAAESSFEKKLAALLDAINSRNYEKLEDFIHPGTGFYVTYPTGAYDAYRHFASWDDFMVWHNVFDHKPLCENCDFSTYKIKWGVPQYFDLFCGGVDAENVREKPEKNILYMEDASRQTHLTDYFRNYSRQSVEDFQSEPLPDDIIEKIKSIESHSYRVASINHEFMIYMTLIDGEWRLTIFATDKDCDA